MAEEGTKGVKDDTSMFAFFALFEKLREHPEQLTNAEKARLVTYGINVERLGNANKVRGVVE